jgi:aldose 1-epimerase
MANRPILKSLPVASALLLIATVVRTQSPGRIQKEAFGTIDGQQVFLFTLRNSSGMEVKITNYGGTITSIKVPDRKKKFDDVALGFNNLDGYTSKTNTGYFGATIGRYANRIAHGRFTLNGHEYQVPTNDGPNSLHGGTKGFDKRVWDAKDASGPGGPGLQFHYLSRDGEEGFPGNLDVTVRFVLGSKNDLRIEDTATTDKDTVLNLTNHSYFNLAGAGSATVLDHKLTLAADRFTLIDSTLIPTGAIQSVGGTPLDFRHATAIGARINEDNEQLKFGKGYDHNFVLNGTSTGQPMLAAKVEEPTSGRVMEILTTQPGIQFYSGNFLDGKVNGIGGTYRYRSALALETQHFPDSPNHSNFPSTVLHPGEQFRSTTIYRFSTE